MNILIFFVVILYSISINSVFFFIGLVIVVDAVFIGGLLCACKCDGIFRRIFRGLSRGFFVFGYLLTLILRNYGIVLLFIVILECDPYQYQPYTFQHQHHQTPHNSPSQQPPSLNFSPIQQHLDQSSNQNSTRNKVP